MCTGLFFVTVLAWTVTFPLSFFNIFYVTFASAAGDGCEVIPEGLVYIT